MEACGSACQVVIIKPLTSVFGLLIEGRTMVEVEGAGRGVDTHGNE